MITRAFVVLFHAVFLLGIKFTLIEALISVRYDMNDCTSDSRCHTFNAEVVFSVIMGFMVIFEIYLTLKRDEQEILSSQRLPDHDVESQMSTVPGSHTQDPSSSAVGLVDSSNVVRPDSLPAQSDPEKPRVDVH
ncbi:hypothetical protein BGZ95_006063 [Linnemannia exigua]|uniref:Uncharacterized protein n=1 Tax=Linnemannia exigua TaxID=604196 RepID=A0AAD4GZZ8_9FUNG|nr:hypothetical protein BGZ95_006063 [Linnemannia exigua]